MFPDRTRSLVKKCPEKFYGYVFPSNLLSRQHDPKTYRKDNLVIIGVPTNNFNQEPGSNSEIKTFCETNFGIDFLMTEKTNVLGKDAHPFYKWAKLNHGSNAIPKWNFHKILINKEGKVADTFASITRPSSSRFIKAIEKQIKN